METPPVSFKKSLTNSLTKSSLTPCRRLGLSRPSSGSLKKCYQLKLQNTPDRTSNGNSVASAKKEVPGLNPTKKCLLLSPEVKLKSPIKNNENESQEESSDKILYNTCENFSSELKLGSEKCSLSKKQNKKRKRQSDNMVSEKVLVNDVENYQLENIKDGVDHSQSDASCQRNPVEGTLIPKLSDSVQKEITPQEIEKLISSIKEKKKKLEQLKVQDVYAKKNNLEELRLESNRWKAAGQEALRYTLHLAKQAGYEVSLKQLMIQHEFPLDLMEYNSEDDEFI